MTSLGEETSLKRSRGTRDELPTRRKTESRAKAAKRSRPMPKPEPPKEEPTGGAPAGSPKGSSGARSSWTPFFITALAALPSRAARSLPKSEPSSDREGEPENSGNVFEGLPYSPAERRETASSTLLVRVRGEGFALVSSAT